MTANQENNESAVKSSSGPSRSSASGASGQRRGRGGQRRGGNGGGSRSNGNYNNRPNTRRRSEPKEAAVAIDTDPRLQRIASGGFPSPTLLQEYEYASEGTVKRLLEMAEKDQEAKRSQEVAFKAHQRRSRRLGQWLGFFTLLAVTVAIIVISLYGHDTVAAVLAAAAFGGAAIASMVASVMGR
jgi:uncharacterized membrane protein